MIDRCWARMRGPLEPHADGLRGELERLGYTPLTAAGHVRLVAHLSRWMIQGGLSVSALTPQTVDAYFAERRAAGYYNSLTARSVRPQERRVDVKELAILPVLSDYGQHMRAGWLGDRHQDL